MRSPSSNKTRTHARMHTQLHGKDRLHSPGRHSAVEDAGKRSSRERPGARTAIEPPIRYRSIFLLSGTDQPLALLSRLLLVVLQLVLLFLQVRRMLNLVWVQVRRRLHSTTIVMYRRLHRRDLR